MTLAELRARLDLDPDATPWELDQAWAKLHRLLGVKPGATAAAVKRAWRRFAATKHTDGAVARGEDLEVATGRFRDARKAFELLTNPDACAAYAASQLPAPPPAPAEPAGGLFVGPGEDLEVGVTLGLADAIRGGPHVFTVDLDAHGSRSVRCDLPPGTEAGLTIRTPGQGGFGFPPGDLVIVINAVEHPTWIVRGLDVLAPLPLTYAQLYEGRQVMVETPWDTVGVRVRPADTRRVRIPGRGVHRGKQQGAMILTPVITYPPAGDPELAEVLRRLQG